MRIVLIGGSGHIGTYLAPRLVEAGHEVINVSRGQSHPYYQHAVWRDVRQVTVDRAAEEERGNFGRWVRDLQPDAVIDLICFELGSVRQLVEALRGEVQHLLHCGTIWVHGPSAVVPTTETQPRRPFGDYGVKKAAIEDYLLDQARRHGLPATILHPGHIVGPGWIPVNPAGNFNPGVFSRLARGEEIILPNLGMETLHHVHADDVAHAFMQALAYRSVTIGESFHVVSDAAVSLRGYAEAVSRWFGKPAQLRFLPWEEWRGRVSDEEAAATWDHIAHSPNCSIAKARSLLGYSPRYSSLQAVEESLDWLVGHGVVETDTDDVLGGDQSRIGQRSTVSRGT